MKSNRTPPNVTPMPAPKASVRIPPAGPADPLTAALRQVAGLSGPDNVIAFPVADAPQPEVTHGEILALLGLGVKPAPVLLPDVTGAILPPLPAPPVPTGGQDCPHYDTGPLIREGAHPLAGALFELRLTPSATAP